MKRYDEWNFLKKELNKKSKCVIPKEREIYWLSIGENIGYEQNGKGDNFSRPVLILKRLSKNIFFGIPLSSKTKDGNFFYNFIFQEKKISALLVQCRLFDTKRLENRIGMINIEDFEKIKKDLNKLLDL